MKEPYRIVVATAPAAYPVSLADAKTHLRMDLSADDTYIDGLIAVATAAAEKFTGRALINRTYDMYLDAWPCEAARSNEWWDGVREGAFVGNPVRALELPFPPLSSVSGVTYYDDSDNATAWASTNYHVDTKSEPGRIALKQGGIVPLPTKTINGIKVSFVAGYGAGASNVPDVIVQAVKMIIAHLYEKRGEDKGEDAVVASGASKMLQAYRVMRFR